MIKYSNYSILNIEKLTEMCLIMTVQIKNLNPLRSFYLH